MTLNSATETGGKVVLHIGGFLLGFILILFAVVTPLAIAAHRTYFKKTTPPIIYH